MVKVLKTIGDYIMAFLNYDSPMDRVELCGWQKCPVPEKKQIIEEDYSI